MLKKSFVYLVLSSFVLMGTSFDAEAKRMGGSKSKAAGAVIVPLFTEGTSAPAMAELPDALRFLKEAHALKLRLADGEIRAIHAADIFLI